MTHTRLFAVLLWTAVMQLASGAVRAAEAHDAQIVAQRFVEAWNAHKPDIFAAVLDPAADWIQARGEKLRGSTAIESYLAQEHRTWAKGTRMTALAIESQLLCADIAIVGLAWQIASDGSDAFRGMTQFVARKEGSRWVVISGQVTSGRGNAVAGAVEQRAGSDAR